MRARAALATVTPVSDPVLVALHHGWRASLAPAARRVARALADPAAAQARLLRQKDAAVLVDQGDGRDKYDPHER